MASKPIIMTITDSAKNAMLDSENTGITLRLEHLAIGSGRYNPSGNETALKNEISRHVITVGDIEPATHTLRLFSVVKATTETEVWELGLYDTENRLFALASSTDKPLFKVYPDIDFVGNFAIKLDAFDGSKVQVVTDPNGALSLVLMSQHLAHPNPHPQYLLRNEYTPEPIKVGGILITTNDYANSQEVRDGEGYGKWAKFSEGQLLLGIGSHTDKNGATRNISMMQQLGEYEHQLTIDEMPSHSHDVNFVTGSIDDRGRPSTDSDSSSSANLKTNALGGDKPHNNIQPSIGVGMWLRLPDDAVMEVAIGALTHENNRAVLTSQPAKGTGFFYDTHHKLSHKNGGKWVALKFNGELSPIVSKDKIIEALYQYGDRNSPGYLIRIRGEFPELKNEFLLTRSEVDNFVKRQAIIKDDERYGFIIAVDVGGGVGRDSSVITVAKVIDRQIKGRFERFVDIVDIPLYSNTADIVVMKARIIDLMSEYEGASLVIDPIGSGAGLTQALKADGIYLTEVNWGSACFKRSNRNYYFNKRSHAYVKFAKAVENGWITISDKVRKNFRVLTPLKEQLTRLPYTFDEKSRWQLLGKKDMKKMGIDSPDIGDTLAFIYMEKINYAPVEDKFTSRQEVKDSQEWDVLDELAEAL